MGQIFHLNGGRIVPLQEVPYDSEDILQSLLAQFPEILGESSSDKGTSWLLIERESGVPDAEAAGGRWALDHLFLDADGVPTLVEVKRSTDTRIRREVVGQMLDYAANAVAYWPLEHMQAQFERRCADEEKDAEAELSSFLGEDGDPEEFWIQVKTNLRAGRIRLVFVADSIPRELGRIVEFLNEQMDPAEVLALEVHQFVGEGTQTLVPRLIGRTAVSEIVKPTGTTRKRLTMEQILHAFEDQAERGAVERLIEEAKRLGMTVFLGTSGASFRLPVPGRARPLSLGWLFPPGTVGWFGLRALNLGFEHSSSTPIPDRLMPHLATYAEAFERIPGAEKVTAKGMRACRFSPPLMVEREDDIRQALRKIVQSLNALE